jgi:peptide-methionine (S)-S-oxide reductase
MNKIQNNKSSITLLFFDAMHVFKLKIIGILIISFITLLNQSIKAKDIMVDPQKVEMKVEKATFGAGCFWCVEAIFERVKGVIKVQSGYSGGHVKNPAYKEVCSGTTGHAEVCQLTFNPDKISYIELLEIFWQTHDPTTLNRQGNDTGTQYRSVIFCHTEEQKRLAEEMKKRLNNEHIFANPIVTEVVAYKDFYPAEDYHEDYYSKNPDQPYCSVVITPKVKKFEKTFQEYLREEKVRN